MLAESMNQVLKVCLNYLAIFFFLSQRGYLVLLFLSEYKVTPEIEVVMKWFKIFLSFLSFPWFCGNDFISLRAFDFLVTFPHTKHKHATCVFDYPWESAVPPVQSQMSGSSFQPLAQSLLKWFPGKQSPVSILSALVSRPCLLHHSPPGPLLPANVGLVPSAPHQEGRPLWSGASRLSFSLKTCPHAQLTPRGSYCQHTVLSDSHAPFSRVRPHLRQNILPAHRILASVFFQGLA